MVKPRAQRGQRRLPGFPRPQGMLEARAALDATERPLYGPERPPGDYSALRRCNLQPQQFEETTCD